MKESAEMYGIDKKILAITCDNASNNDTLVTELELSGGANSERTRVRCFAHVWNLVVKVSTHPAIAYPATLLNYDRQSSGCS